MNFIDAHQLVMFIAAGWLLNLTPGPDVLYIVTDALRSGTRAGIVAGLGITAGCFVHIFAAAVGVGALLATSATAFTVLKWIGAAYLLYIAYKLWTAPAAARRAAAPSRVAPWSNRAAAAASMVSSTSCNRPKSLEASPGGTAISARTLMSADSSPARSAGRWRGATAASLTTTTRRAGSTGAISPPARASRPGPITTS